MLLALFFTQLLPPVFLYFARDDIMLINNTLMPGPRKADAIFEQMASQRDKHKYAASKGSIIGYEFVSL